MLAGAVVAADQLSKAWALRSLANGAPRLIIGDTLAFELGFNDGAAFSLFGGGGFTAMLALITSVVAVVLVRLLRTTKDRPTVFALALILGGALGNLSDRIFRQPGIFRGHVVDFISVRNIPYFDRWPIFNIADAAIVVGVLMVLLRSLKQDENQTDNSKSDPVAEPESQPLTSGE